MAIIAVFGKGVQHEHNIAGDCDLLHRNEPFNEQFWVLLVNFKLLQD